MELVGEKIVHKSFGAGSITAYANDRITVLFEATQEEKKFAYPSCVGPFLTFNNTVIQNRIEEVQNAIIEEKAEAVRAKKEFEQAVAAEALAKERSKKRATKKAALAAEKE